LAIPRGTRPIPRFLRGPPETVPRDFLKGGNSLFLTFCRILRFRPPPESEAPGPGHTRRHPPAQGGGADSQGPPGRPRLLPGRMGRRGECGRGPQKLQCAPPGGGLGTTGTGTAGFQLSSKYGIMPTFRICLHFCQCKCRHMLNAGIIPILRLNSLLCCPCCPFLYIF
jgi:hypothetical protein